MGDDKVAGEKENKESTTTTPAANANPRIPKKPRGIISRIWNGLFRIHGDDFEKRLQHISKEEAFVLARVKRRSQTWRKMARNIIIFSVIFEVFAVGYAIMTTRSSDLNWKMRAFRVLPMFLLPGLSSVAYSALSSFTKMCDRKDQKTLERLRAERKAKIDELKEKTNYYTTQQLIQRYDTDPAAKAAAATVLASKLGADSGLKVHVGDESNQNVPTGKSNDVELARSSGLRNRKQLHGRSTSTGSTPLLHYDEETLHSARTEDPHASEHNQLVVDHRYPQGSTPQDGGWIARIAALLVGEDPTQSYALICGNCHMHNGLARKEDLPYIAYYCPHCHALNRPTQFAGRVSGSSSPDPNMSSLKTEDSFDVTKSASELVNDSVSTNDDGPVRDGPEIEEVTETVGSENLVS